MRDDALHVIDSIPAADVVEVVRCKDCKYCDISLVLPTGRLMYTCMDGTHDHQTLLDPNDFCSRGERSDSNERVYRTREDYIQYGIEPYIDIGGKGEDHTCAPCKWISVKDRLPEEDENYIVIACDEGCSAGEGIWYSTVVVVAEYYKGSWTWYDGGSEYSLEGIVTHWMPMPSTEGIEDDT